MRRVLSRCTSKLVAHHLPDRCYSSRNRASVPLKSYAIQAAEEVVAEEPEETEEAVQHSLHSSGEHAVFPRSAVSTPGRHAMPSAYVYQHVLPAASPTSPAPTSPAARPKLAPLTTLVADGLSSGASSMSASGAAPGFSRSLSSRARPLLPSLLAQPFPLPPGSPALQNSGPQVPPLAYERSSWNGSAPKEEASCVCTADSPMSLSAASHGGWETPPSRTLPALSSPGQGAERPHLMSPGAAPGRAALLRCESAGRARGMVRSESMGRPQGTGGATGWEQLQGMRRSNGGGGGGVSISNDSTQLLQPRMSAFHESRGLKALEQLADGLDTPLSASSAGPPSLGVDLSTDMVGRIHSMPGNGGDGPRMRGSSMPGHSPLAGQASYVSSSGAGSFGHGSGSGRTPRRPSGSNLAPVRQSDPVGSWVGGKPAGALAPIKPPSPNGLVQRGSSGPGLPTPGKAAGGKSNDASKLFQEWREKKKKDGVVLGDDGMPIVQDEGESFFSYVQRRMAGSPAGKR